MIRRSRIFLQKSDILRGPHEIIVRPKGDKNFVSEWGERRQPSPNDAGVILSDRLAEREEYGLHFANVATRWAREHANEVGALEVLQKMHIRKQNEHILGDISKEPLISMMKGTRFRLPLCVTN